MDEPVLREDTHQCAGFERVDTREAVVAGDSDVAPRVIDRRRPRHNLPGEPDGQEATTLTCIPDADDARVGKSQNTL